MTDMLDAVSRLASQLRDAGIPPHAARATLTEYLLALVAPDERTWSAFYHSIYQRLRDLAMRDYPFVGQKAQPLLAILDDDFGSTLVPADERARIRQSLVECAPRETRVPS